MHSNWKKRLEIIIASSAVMIFLLWLYLKIDPAGEDFGIWFPKCPVHLLTGFSCPSCGIQRAFHAFLNGHPIDALRQNWFIIFSGLYLLGMGGSRMMRKRFLGLYKFFWGTKGGWTYVWAYVAWFVIRNLLGV